MTYGDDDDNTEYYVPYTATKFKYAQFKPISPRSGWVDATDKRVGK